MKPASARHRTDTTARALAAEAMKNRVEVAPLGGAIDAIWWIPRGTVRGTVRLVDYKSPGGTRTRSQQDLVDRGCPIHFIATIEQARELCAAMWDANGGRCGTRMGGDDE